MDLKKFLRRSPKTRTQYKTQNEILREEVAKIRETREAFIQRRRDAEDEKRLSIS